MTGLEKFKDWFDKFVETNGHYPLIREIKEQIEMGIENDKTNTEANKQNDSKTLLIPDISNRFCELSYDIWDCGLHGDYVTGCLECKHFK